MDYCNDICLVYNKHAQSESDEGFHARNQNTPNCMQLNEDFILYENNTYNHPLHHHFPKRELLPLPKWTTGVWNLHINIQRASY